MKVFLDIQDGNFLALNRENAASKPRMDALRILTEEGYVPVVAYGDFSWEGRFPATLGQRVRKKINRILFGISLQTAFRRVASMLKTGVGDAEIVVQYPFLSPRMLDVLRSLKSVGGFTLTVLIHDFYTIRENRSRDEMEYSLLSVADRLVVHTQPMADVLRSMGCKAEIRLLHYFDYLLDDDIPLSGHECCKGICYAGNLDKAPFVRLLCKLPLTVFLYGRRPQSFDIDGMHGSLSHEGSFQADSPRGIKGEWGLVWDGDSADTCSGPLGNYLRYNAPFKFSMYIAIGKPVVVCSGSAMARYVREQHLGICVDSIWDIPQTIQSLSDHELDIISDSVRRAALTVRKGGMLKAAIRGNTVDGV